MDTSVILTKPTVPAYSGMRWVYHRLTHKAEYMYDARPLMFEAGEYKQIPEQQAIWLFEYHAKREHPSRYEDPDPAVRLEAVEYAFALDDDPHFGIPLILDDTEGREYLSRDGQAMYLQRGSDIPTHPKLIKVGEVPQPAASTVSQQSAEPGQISMLLNKINELEAQLNEKPIRGRRRPRSRMVHKAQEAGQNSTAEAPATS